MMSLEEHTVTRIPIHIVKHDDADDMPVDNRVAPLTLAVDAASPNDDDPAADADELGRASIYEDATEMKRRIERGGEQSKDRADDADTAGAPPETELPENRGDLDTNPNANVDDDFIPPLPPDQQRREEEANQKPHRAAAPSDATAASSSVINSQTNFGPAAIELIATRAELKRVENELRERDEQLQKSRESADQLLRLQADFDNYRRRSERARGEARQQLVAEVVGRLLPVADNLQRALDNVSVANTSASPEFQQFAHGVELIKKQVLDVLQAYGVEAIESVGTRFNPEVHEAIAIESADEVEPDTVISEIVRGYRLGDKLLRPAMVKVAK